MGRLIDTDVLKADFEDMTGGGFKAMIDAWIDEQPTVDAIPLDWLERRMNETALTDVPLNNALFTVGVEWEKAKKRGDVDG